MAATDSFAAVLTPAWSFGTNRATAFTPWGGPVSRPYRMRGKRISNGTLVRWWAYGAPDVAGAGSGEPSYSLEDVVVESMG